jgi:anti-sigma factor RsiW
MKDEPMNPPDHDPAAIRALLETLQRQQGQRAIPTTDDLVGWLDGTLPADRRAAVKEALTQQPELRRALAAARLGREEAVPAAELAALERLVPAPVVAFPVAAQRGSRWALPLAAAAAVALLVPAWTIGSGIAEQRRTAEDRALREFLNGGLAKGGL